MNWKETIEAQIALLKDRHWRFHPHSPTDIDVANSLLTLLDVAVAAETYERLDNTNARLSMRRALDKLRKVSDE